MAVNLKLGDRLAIIRDGVKKGYTPQEAMLQYQINKDGGYNNWKNQFRLTTGINPDLDDTYNYELFFKENPEAAKQLILGEVSPDILQMYKTPLAIQREKQVLQQRQKGNVNSLMDYAQYEKLINDYMNKSVNVSSCGGPISINMYAEGTDNLNEKRTDITKFGTLESEYKDTRTPNFIDITPEELQNFINNSGRTITIDIPKDNLEGVPEEYKNLPKTRFIRIPYQFLKDRNYNVDDLKEDEAITYYLLDFNENDEYGNPREYYTIRKVNKHTPVGRAYDYWKRDQRLGNVLNSDWLYKDDKNIKEGPVDINNTVLLSDVTVTPENNRRFESDTAIPGKYNQQEKYIDPFNIGGTELNVPNNTLYNTQGTKGGSSFGTSTDGLRMPDAFNLGLQYQEIPFQYTPYLWQLEDLEYLNPPGYVPIPNWNVALVYDTGAEGTDFANFLKMLAGYGRDNSLRDELMAKLFEPKDYFADPYAGSHYTDTQSFYDAYDNNPYSKIQRESNGIPLYAKGGKVNIFDGYGSSYIPQGYEQYVYEPKTINGIEYAKLPKSYANTDIKVSNLEGKTTDDYEYVFVRKDPKTNRYLNTQYNRDIANINTYRSGKLPELVTWDENASAASAYDANSELNKTNIANQIYWDPINKEIRRRFNDMAVANRTLGRNNWWEGVGIAMTPFNLVMPSNIYGSIAKLIQEGGNFADYLLSGNNLGFAQTTQGTRDWAEQHPYLNTGVNLLGDALAFWAPRAPRDINAAIKAGSLKYNYYKLAKELGNNIKNTEFDWNYNRPNFNRTRIGDLEINNPNTMYHIDNGNKIGAFNNGAVIENGVLKAGIPKNIGDVPYVWWNLGKPYMNHINGKPANRIITSPQTEDFIHVRSQDYPIGLWNGNTGFVTNTEYVTQNPLNVDNLNIYKFDPNYGYRKINANVETQPIEFNTKTNVGSSFDELKWNPETGDFKSTVTIDNNIIQKYVLEQAINKISRGEELNKLDEIALGSREAKLKNAENLDNIFNNQVFSRLNKEYFTEPILNEHTRMPKHFKRMQEDKFKEFESALSSGEYVSVDLSIIDTLIGRGFGGYYNPSTNKIVVSNGLNAYEILPHEFRHMLDNVKGLPENLQIILDNAYNFKFENLPELVPEGDPLKGYKNMRAEKVTTNFDARKELLGTDINLPLKTLNRIIDQSSDKAIINAVKNSNGYGKKYIKVLEDWIAKSKAEGLMDTEKEYPTWLITAFKNAMKYVPITTGIAYGTNKTD